jgi:hypothetical protein
MNSCAQFCDKREDFFVELCSASLQLLWLITKKLVREDRKNMQQPPDTQNPRSLRLRQAHPAVPDMTLPTTPIYISASRRRNWPQLPPDRRVSTTRRVSFQLLLSGLLLGLCALLLYPLLGEHASAAQLLPTLFPWLPALFWTARFPFLLTAISRVSWLDLKGGSPVAAANLALIVLGVALALLFFTARACQRAVPGRSQKGPMRFLLLQICFFTLLLGALFVLLPGGTSQETLLSGLYGRLILIYHVNPYLATPGLLAHDPLYRVLPPGSFVSPLAGPLWLDLTVPLAWVTGGNPAFVLLGFRAAALCLHLFNTLLIRAILTKLKPEIRLGGTLLYAWNPALLLLGVSEMHTDLAVIFFLLLGALFFQHRSLLLSWICLLLATLINPLCLLLLPLFLRALARETRMLSRGRRALWWFALLIFSALVIVLAYAPYWSSLGAGGIALRLRAVFWPDSARSSLLVALRTLPFVNWPPAAWLLTPHHWMILPAFTAGALLLLGIWIVDTLELALLFGSWIFLVLVLLLPVSSPWLIVLPLTLALASSSRRTALLAHLLTAGMLLAYGLALWPARWDGQALVTLGLPALLWGWALFFLSTWEMTHRESEEAAQAPQSRGRLGLSRPSWPSRPAAWPSRPGSRRR